MTFYERYIELCVKINKSPSAVALENGFSKASVNHWKTGRAKPSDVSLSKLAAYFNVSVEYLKGEAEEVEEKEQYNESGAKEKTASISGSGLTADELDFILKYRSLSPEKKEALRVLAEQK